jgi:hypothetical protein
MLTAFRHDASLQQLFLFFRRNSFSDFTAAASRG